MKRWFNIYSIENENRERTDRRFDAYIYLSEKVQVGNVQGKAQSERDPAPKEPRLENTKLTIRYLYHENTS